MLELKNTSGQFRLKQPTKLVLPTKVMKFVPATSVAFNRKHPSFKNRVQDLGNGDYTVGREYILMLLNEFTSVDLITGENKVIKLNSTILKRTIGKVYTKVIKLLVEMEAITLVSNYYADAHQSRSYQLSSKLAKHVELAAYEAVTTSAVRLLTRGYNNVLDAAKANVIGQSILQSYDNAILPKLEDVQARGQELILAKYCKKGKVMNKSRLACHIKIFKYLVEAGLLLPKISHANAGGRVTSSFTLLPSWIRSMITFDAGQLVECDYSSLHPNIALSVYGHGGKTSHDEVASYLNISRAEAKIEHLSFFNKRIVDMKRSPLWKFYSEQHPVMMHAIINEKSKGGHKVTCSTLFSTEVALMTKAAEILANEQITVLYVYDALYASVSSSVRVAEVMNHVAITMNIQTQVN